MGTLADQHHPGITDQIRQYVAGRHPARGVDGDPADEFGRTLTFDGRCGTGGRCGEKFAHLVIGDLGEIPERLTHRQKGGRHGCAHDVLDDPGELAAGGFRGGGYGHDDLGGQRLPQRLHRGQHRGPGGQAVVDQDHRLAGNLQWRTALPVGGLTPGQFVGFPVGDLAQLLRRDPQTPHHVVVDDHPPATGQRPHCELLVPGRSEFADDERIQWCAQGAGHLEGDRQAAPGQAEHHHPRLVPVGAQHPGQDPAGLPAVAEHPSRVLSMNAAGSRHDASPDRCPSTIRPSRCARR